MFFIFFGDCIFRSLYFSMDKYIFVHIFGKHHIRIIFHLVFYTPFDTFLDIGFHMKVDFIRLIPVFNQCQRAINIINLDLPNDRTGFLQFVVVKKRDFYTIEKTPNKSGVIANCRHQLFKNGRIIIAIGI